MTNHLNSFRLIAVGVFLGSLRDQFQRFSRLI